MFVRAEWETASLRLSSFSPHLHLWQDYVLKVQSNIFINMFEMEDSYILKEYTEDLRVILDIALHHACMQVSCIQTMQHKPGPPGPEHQICGLSEPESHHLYTLYKLTHCSPVISHTSAQPAGSYDLSGQGMGTWMCCLYRVTGQSQYLTFYSPDASLWRSVAPHMAALSNVANAGRSLDWLFDEWLDSLNPWPPLHGLALTNFLDCNTRHVECSTCCVLSLGTHSPTNTTTMATTILKHAEVLNGEYNTDTSRIKKTNQGKYLIIYLNSLVLNLCLYTVNSVMLQRITSKQTLRNFDRC